MSGALNSPSDAFQVVGFVIANGSPVAGSTLKKFTRLCDGWLKPQQPKWLPEYGKFRRSPKFALIPFGSPSFAEAWNAQIVSSPLASSAKPVQTRSKLVSSLYRPLFMTAVKVCTAAPHMSGVVEAAYTCTRPLYALAVHCPARPLFRGTRGSS